MKPCPCCEKMQPLDMFDFETGDCRECLNDEGEDSND